MASRLVMTRAVGLGIVFLMDEVTLLENFQIEIRNRLKMVCVVLKMLSPWFLAQLSDRLPKVCWMYILDVLTHCDRTRIAAIPYLLLSILFPFYCDFMFTRCGGNTWSLNMLNWFDWNREMSYIKELRIADAFFDEFESRSMIWKGGMRKRTATEPFFFFFFGWGVVSHVSTCYPRFCLVCIPQGNGVLF